MNVPVGRNHELTAYELDSYSAFQRQRLQEIVESGDFDFACTRTSATDDRGRPRRPGPFGFLWYTLDGRMHFEKIGVVRVLREIARP